MLLVSASGLFGTSHNMDYKNNTPFDYAVLAKAAYRSSQAGAQRCISELIKNRSGMTVLDYEEYDGSNFLDKFVYGAIRLIIVRDKDRRLHVAIDGTSSIRNAKRDVAILVRSLFSKYGVPPRARNDLHDIIKGWEYRFKGKVTTVCGHSLGGAFASQVVNSHNKHYCATVITFNALKPVDRENQIHFAIKDEHLSKLFSSHKKYIPLEARAHWRSTGKHKLKCFLSALKRKNWSDLGL